MSLGCSSLHSPFARRELFLRKNNVSDIQELRWLSGLQQLHVLWLAENPVTATPNCPQPFETQQRSAKQTLVHFTTCSDPAFCSLLL